MVTSKVSPCTRAARILQVEAWGPNSARVRSTSGPSITGTPGSALGEPAASRPVVEVSDGAARLRNGDLVVEVAANPGGGFLQFPPLVRFSRADNGGELLSEQSPHFTSPPQRRYTQGAGGTDGCEVTFNPSPGERIYGLGQHQHGLLDQKGTTIDLIQRNTEVCVPFALSSRGYGFLWNMPGVGRVELGANRTRWVADAARQLDYWVTTASTPAEIVSQYTQATGLPPMLPAWASGFWQCKLRYRNQEELLAVAREHKRRGLPLAVIVIDYFHWTRQGEWRFDSTEWPDPQAMVDELRELGVELMVSVWPTVNPNSEYHAEMDRRGFLVGNARAACPSTSRSGTRATTARSSCASMTRPTPTPAAMSGTKSPRVTVATGSGRSGLTPANRRCAPRTPRATCTTWAGGAKCSAPTRASTPAALPRGYGPMVKKT